MSDISILGLAIKEAREARNFSLVDLAIMTGIPEAKLQLIESRQEEVHFRLVVSICMALNITLTTLINLCTQVDEDLHDVKVWKPRTPDEEAEIARNSTSIREQLDALKRDPDSPFFDPKA